MTFETYRAAKASLREFSFFMRRRHRIVKFYSDHHGAFRFARILGTEVV